MLWGLAMAGIQRTVDLRLKSAYISKLTIAWDGGGGGGGRPPSWPPLCNVIYDEDKSIHRVERFHVSPPQEQGGAQMWR